MNGSFDSIEKTPSAFTSLDTTSYDFYETQSNMQNTGVSTGANSEFEDFSRHPMGRPRPRPSDGGIHGLPVLPPQAPPGHKAMVHSQQQVRADVLTKPSFDLTFENQNFRETPSMGSMHPQSEYWDSTSRLQSNGNAVKYKNTNNNLPSSSVNEHNLPRSISMATTMPLVQQSSIEHLADFDDSEPNNINNMSPASLHQIGLPLHNIKSHHHHQHQHYPTTSQSYDQLELERLDQYDHDQYRPHPDETYRPNILSSHAQSNAHGAVDSSPSTTASLKDSSPSSTSRGGGDTTDPVSYFDSPKLDPGDEKNQSGSRKARVIETSLDDLEVDYELDETNVRPVSTYLETNVDDALPPIRSARSQFIPTTSSGTGGVSYHHNQPISHVDEFKALSSRSKSMPLETEM